MAEKYLIIYGSGTLGFDASLIDHTCVTSPLDIGPQRIVELTLKREPIIPDVDFRVLREKPRRDWEQRNRRRRK